MTDWVWVWGVVSVLGVVAGFMAYWKARSSDSAAKDSLTISKRSEARETEVHFVDWTAWWEAPGVFRLLNTGDDEAHDVKLVLYVDDEPFNEYAEIIHGGEPLDFDVPRARERWEKGRSELTAILSRRKQEVADQSANRARAAADTSVFGSIAKITAYASDVTVSHSMDAMHDHAVGTYDVRYRVFWRTGLGTPKDSGYQMHGSERLGPDYESR